MLTDLLNVIFYLLAVYGGIFLGVHLHRLRRKGVVLYHSVRVMFIKDANAKLDYAMALAGRTKRKLEFFLRLPFARIPILGPMYTRHFQRQLDLVHHAIEHNEAIRQSLTPSVPEQSETATQPFWSYPDGTAVH
jgi:hypothetical protein